MRRLGWLAAILSLILACVGSCRDPTPAPTRGSSADVTDTPIASQLVARLEEIEAKDSKERVTESPDGIWRVVDALTGLGIAGTQIQVARIVTRDAMSVATSEPVSLTAEKDGRFRIPAREWRGEALIAIRRPGYAELKHILQDAGTRIPRGGTVRLRPVSRVELSVPESEMGRVQFLLVVRWCRELAEASKDELKTVSARVAMRDVPGWRLDLAPGSRSAIIDNLPVGVPFGVVAYSRVEDRHRAFGNVVHRGAATPASVALDW